jgi:hypothetical protein
VPVVNGHRQGGQSEERDAENLAQCLDPTGTVITALYTVAAGQNTADLAVVGFNLNGATVTDVAGNPGNTTGTVINPAGILRVDTSVPTIVIATPIAGDNAVNRGEAAAGFAIAGTTVGADDGQPVTVTIVDSANAVVDTFSPTVTGNAWSIDVPPAQAQTLADGSYTVRANVSDIAGNQAPQAIQSLTVDRTAPTIAIAGDNAVNRGEATAGFAIAGTTVGAEDGQTATITIVNGANAIRDTFTATVTGNAWSVGVSPEQALALADGNYTVQADVSDAAGNPASPATQSLTVDETPPSVPSALVLAPVSDSGVLGDTITNVALPTVTGSAEAGSTVTLFDGTTLLGSGTADAATGAWSITATTALSPGANTLVAQATDGPGNTSAASDPLTITLDTTAATVSSVTASPGTSDLNAGKVVTLTLALSKAVNVVTTGGTPSLSLNGGGVANYVSGSGTASLVFGYTVGAGQNTADLAVTGSSLNGGTITDPAGNAVDLSGAVTNPSGTLQIDTTVPTIAVALIAGDNTVNAGEAAAGFAITGTTLGVENGRIATITIVDGAQTTIDTYTTNVTANAWSINVTTAQAAALSDGIYTVRANVSDAAGNPAIPATQALTVDKAAPTIAVALIAGDNTVNLGEATTGFAISGTTAGVEDGQTATVTIVDSANAVTATFTTAVTGNAWSATVTPAQAQALADGTYTVQANVTDIAGNPAHQVSQSLTVNETAPGAPGALRLAPVSDSGIPGDSITNVALPVITGSAEAGSAVALFRGATLIGTGTADAVTGAWSITATSALTPGANTLTARDTDAAGNISAPSNPLTVTLDTTAPTVSAVAAAPGTADLAAGQVVTLTLTLSEAVTVVTTDGPPSLTLNDGGTASYVSGIERTGVQPHRAGRAERHRPGRHRKQAQRRHDNGRGGQCRRSGGCRGQPRGHAADRHRGTGDCGWHPDRG